METKRILIVEDEAPLAGIMVNMLEYFNFQGEVAVNGEEALDKIKSGEFAYLIIDLSLPDLNGMELYRQIIKRHPDYRGKVAFTSGFNVTDELKKLLEKDELAFLPKPFSIDKFKEVMENWK